MSNPFQVVKQFEEAISEYTGAPHVVTTSSCTMALLLSLAYVRMMTEPAEPVLDGFTGQPIKPVIEIPRRTYVSVPMSILHADWRVSFRDEDWSGGYALKPTLIWDYARRFTSGMYVPSQLQCVSFHWSKILGIQQGGAILHDNDHADKWLRRARFDGRTEGVPPKYDDFSVLGWHAYMSPEIAAEGLVRLAFLPKHNADLPNDDYPDLSKIRIFR